MPSIKLANLDPKSIEFMERDIVDSSAKFTGNAIFPPVVNGMQAGVYILVTLVGDSESELSLKMDSLGELAARVRAYDVLVLWTAGLKMDAWAARVAFLTVIEAETKLLDEIDVVVPVDRIADFLVFTHDEGQRHNITIRSFGHAGDGNLHIYCCSNELEPDAFKRRSKLVMDSCYAKCNEFGGQVFGEHAIGHAREKMKNFLHILLCLVVILSEGGEEVASGRGASDAAEKMEDIIFSYGIKAIQIQRETDHALAGPLTAERLKTILHQYQTVYGNSDNYNSAGPLKDEVYCNEILPYNAVLNLMRRVYSPSRTYDPDILSSVNGGMVDRFYETRHAQIQSIMNMDYTTGNYSQAEKDAVIRLDNKVSKPMTFDYSEGWTTLLVRAFSMIFVLVGLAVCITISPVFAYEYQTGADAVVLSSRYGRRETVRAKIAAGFLATSGIYLAAVFVSFASILAVFGMQGWNCEYQIMSTASVYCLKIWQVALFGVFINYVVVLSVMAFTTLLSAACKTPFAAVITSTLCTAAPLLFPTSQTNGFINKIISLLPVKAMDTHAVFSSYVLFPIGKTVITLPCMILISACVLISVTLPAAQRKFCKHQVV